MKIKSQEILKQILDKYNIEYFETNFIGYSDGTSSSVVYFDIEINNCKVRCSSTGFSNQEKIEFTISDVRPQEIKNIYFNKCKNCECYVPYGEHPDYTVLTGWCGWFGHETTEDDFCSQKK